MAFRPAGPYPLLNIGGEHGSAKTTAMRAIRRLIDPRQVPDRSAPGDERDLAIHALHHRVVALDNLSAIPDTLSDSLARLATGSGFSTRQLYSDADEYSFASARPVMLTAIEDVIVRSDLLDRAVAVRLAPIDDRDRMPEADLWQAFDAERPVILGAILDAVSCAIARERTVTLERLPRMADFARWVTAAEPSLGWPDGSFLQAYERNRLGVHEIVLEDDPVASAVRALMLKVPAWEGSATDLLERLGTLVGEALKRQSGWPKAGHVLTGRLDRLAPNLRAVGIDYARSRTKNRRAIVLGVRGRASSASSTSSDGRERTPDAELGRHAASSLGRSASPAIAGRMVAGKGPDGGDADDALLPSADPRTGTTARAGRADDVAPRTAASPAVAVSVEDQYSPGAWDSDPPPAPAPATVDTAPGQGA